MGELTLFDCTDKIVQLYNTTVSLERELQLLIEKNMDLFFGVRFLASEYKITNGRIDSLGIDENNCPVIFEYKRNTSENVINQGLFYLDWLLDHRADFQLLVMKIFGESLSNEIEWTAPCVMCIANDFTKYDEHAVNQMQRNIKLVRYRKYTNDLILFEHLNAPVLHSTELQNNNASKIARRTLEDEYQMASDNIKLLYDSVVDYIMALGDDITENKLQLWTAFKKVKNFACIVIKQSYIKLYLHLATDDILEQDNYFIRDVSNVGHWGTGDVEITIKDETYFEKSKSYIDKAYHAG